MFRLAGLSENVGFGMKKILLWKELTGKDVEITSAIDYSLVTFTLGKATNVGKEHPKKLPEKTIAIRKILLETIKETPECTIEYLATLANVSKDAVKYHIKSLTSEGIVKREGRKGGRWIIIDK